MNIDYIKSRIEKKEDILLIEKAYKFALEKLSGVYYKTGETLINHILGVVNTLIDFNADSLTIVSCILYETINNGVDKEEIKKEFDITVSNIVLGVPKIINLELNEDGESYLNELKADSNEDVRILFIKLADQFYSMQEMHNFEREYQKKVARETLYVLTPFASKLRLNYIKSKLEDLCLYYLNPEVYNDILKKLNASPIELNMYLNNMKESISNLLIENGINFTIKGRVKNIYSIYNKLCSGKSWEEIYDILAIRILVEDKKQCYEVAELIHSKYTKVPSRFKDYIIHPKENMYQGLHTTVIGDGNRIYETQIRTKEMHKIAEEGSASHYWYKRKTLKKYGNKI